MHVPLPRGHWPLRPRQRARRLRHRARRQAVGRRQPRGRREGARRAREPRAPRCRGRRPEHRRRRRDPAAGARRLPAGRGRGRRASPPGRYGVGVCYLPTDPERRVVIEQLIEETIEAEGQRPMWWRDVPVDDRHVGETARLCAPVIRQVLIEASEEIEDQDAFERKLYVIRRVIERAAGRELALPSFSSRTIVYKGMLTAPQLPRYFTDLRDPRLASQAGARPLALLDQHLPQLGAGPPLPDDRPQRRGQHAARQRQLDARPRVAARLRAVRRRPPEGDPGRPRGRLGLGHLRQRARAAGAQRALDPARGDDDGPRGLPHAQGPRSRRQGVLRLPLVPDGAMGRAGGGRLHRRARSPAPCSTETAFAPAAGSRTPRGTSCSPPRPA